MDLSQDREHDHTHLRDFPTTQIRAWWDLVSGRFGNRGSFRVSQLKKGLGTSPSPAKDLNPKTRTPLFQRPPSSQTQLPPLSLPILKFGSAFQIS